MNNPLHISEYFVGNAIAVDIIVVSHYVTIAFSIVEERSVMTIYVEIFTVLGDNNLSISLLRKRKSSKGRGKLTW